MHYQEPHRVAVGGLSQRRMQRIIQEHNANASPRTISGYYEPSLPMRPMASPLTQQWSPQTGVSPHNLKGELSVTGTNTQHAAFVHHPLQVSHQVRSSEANSWARLLFASCCITLTIFVILFIFGAIDVDTGPPTRWMDRTYTWACSIFAIRGGSTITASGLPGPFPVTAVTDTSTRTDMPRVSASAESERPVGVNEATPHETQISAQHRSAWPTGDALASTIAAVATAATVAAGRADSVASTDLQQHSTMITGSAEVPPSIAPHQGSSAANASPLPSRLLGSKGEDAALAALQRIFGNQFVFTKERPAWLRNPESGRCLELDLFNEELMLGVEVDGIQHYVPYNSFHKDRKQFDDQVRRDRLKDVLCQQRGVLLIRIPFTVPLNQYEAFTRQQLKESGFRCTWGRDRG